MKIVIFAIKYEKNQWKICRNLKVLSRLMGLQGGYTKHMDFLCLWTSRADAEHYVRKEWPARPKDAPGGFNCLYKAHGDPEKISLPSLLFKLTLKLAKKYHKSNGSYRYRVSVPVCKDQWRGI